MVVGATANDYAMARIDLPFSHHMKNFLLFSLKQLSGPYVGDILFFNDRFGP